MLRPVLVVFTSLLCVGIVWPVLPFQAMSLGASPQLVTLMLTTHTFIILLSAPVFGRLSDRVGRKSVILLGLAFEPVAYTLMAGADSLAMLFASRILAGFGVSAVLPVLQAAIADETDTRQRMGGMAAFNGAYGLAFIVGPLITYQASGPGGDDFPNVAMVASGVAIANLAIAMIVLPPRGGERRRRRSRRVQAARAPYRGLLTPHCAIPIVAMVMLGFVFSGWDATIGIWSASTMDWGARQLSIAYMLAGFAAVVTQFFLAARLTRRFGELPVAGGSATLFILALLLLAFIPEPASVGTAMVLLGSGVATANSCLSTLYSKATPPDLQGFVMGVSEAARRAAWILGPLWGGFCLTHLGIASPYTSGAVIMLGAIFLLAWLAGFTLLPTLNRSTGKQPKC